MSRSKEGKCHHCGGQLSYEYGGHGEGCYVKHGCIGEIREYIFELTRYQRMLIVWKLDIGNYNIFDKYNLLGYGQPVNFEKVL